MALTFPRDMPEPLRLRSALFEPSYGQLRAPTRGGLTQVVNILPDLWTMRFETVPLRRGEALAWQTWLQTLRGGARLFKAWHPLLEYLQAYPAGYAGLTRFVGGAAFDGTCTLNAIGAQRDEVTLTGLPFPIAFSIGDMLSLPFGADGRALHRVTEIGTIAGGSATLGVEPIVPLAAVSGVTVTLTRPWCKAVLDAGSVDGPWQSGQRAAIRFSAVQVY